MSTALHIDEARSGATVPLSPRRIAAVRAVLALLWAGALALAVHGKVPTTDSDVPTGVALLLATYPLIDVVSSLFNATFGDTRVYRLNATLSSLAVVGIGITAFGSDAGATLVAFGAWAAVSGLMLLGISIHRRRSHGGQLPLILSGAISTLGGINFIVASGNDQAHLMSVAAYMTFGAVLFILSTVRIPLRRRQAR